MKKIAIVFSIFAICIPMHAALGPREKSTQVVLRSVENNTDKQIAIQYYSDQKKRLISLAKIAPHTKLEKDITFHSFNKEMQQAAILGGRTSSKPIEHFIVKYLLLEYDKKHILLNVSLFGEYPGGYSELGLENLQMKIFLSLLMKESEKKMELTTIALPKKISIRLVLSSDDNGSLIIGDQSELSIEN